jgi:hypothetical protein
MNIKWLQQEEIRNSAVKEPKISLSLFTFIISGETLCKHPKQLNLCKMLSPRLHLKQAQPIIQKQLNVAPRRQRNTTWRLRAVQAVTRAKLKNTRQRLNAIALMLRITQKKLKRPEDKSYQQPVDPPFGLLAVV